MIGAVSLKPVQDLGMNALLRAALAGAVIGLLESILWSHGPEDDGTGAMLMLFVPFPLGLLLCRLAVLPLWGVVAGVAPFIIMLLFGACLERLTMPEIMDFGIVQGTLIFMGIGASGYVAATALVMPGRKVLSLSTTGAVLVLYCAVAVLQGSRRGGQSRQDRSL
ncbi:hypothetical protein [Nonomuraea sp. bgisy101]|uniref:hypothetical protein n=1 Tax=Nonomuraea sp. bgisy101 TaxID=3413784 RepID=UPI003D75538A